MVNFRASLRVLSRIIEKDIKDLNILENDLEPDVILRIYLPSSV